LPADDALADLLRALNGQSVTGGWHAGNPSIPQA
jgi:hypothetical protein